jgi:hypothetical protein
MNNKQWSKTEIEKLTALRLDGLTWEEISMAMGISANCARKAFYRYVREDVEPRGQASAPKVLIFDIETAPMEAYVWGLFNHPGCDEYQI